MIGVDIDRYKEMPSQPLHITLQMKDKEEMIGGERRKERLEERKKERKKEGKKERKKGRKKERRERKEKESRARKMSEGRAGQGESERKSGRKKGVDRQRLIDTLLLCDGVGCGGV